MTKFLSYPSIEQFRTTVKTFSDRARFHNVAISDLPKLKFHGTVKLHGTNGGIGLHVENNVIYVQSRSNVLSLDSDNAGFCSFAMKNKEIFYDLLMSIANYKLTSVCGYAFTPSHVMVYGEWCGGNIQKGVALNKLPKMFMIFGVKMHYEDQEENYQDIWLNHTEVTQIFAPLKEKLKEYSIYHIEDFKTFDVEVDMSNPQLAINELVAITEAVEKQCPVGMAFGSDGIGEGVVYRCITPHLIFKTSDLAFKVKGEKHSDTKPKVLVAVDVEKLESVSKFVDYVITDHRLEKMLDKLKLEGLDVDLKNTGQFLKLVSADVLKEESDTLVASNLIWKDVVGQLNKKAREWFMKISLEFDVELHARLSAKEDLGSNSFF